MKDLFRIVITLLEGCGELVDPSPASNESFGSSL